MNPFFLNVHLSMNDQQELTFNFLGTVYDKFELRNKLIILADFQLDLVAGKVGCFPKRHFVCNLSVICFYLIIAYFKKSNEIRSTLTQTVPSVFSPYFQ